MTKNLHEVQQSIHYIGGVGEWLNFHSVHRAKAEAVVFGDLRLDYETLNSRVNRLANAFTEKGIQKGDRIALLLLNGNAFLEAFFACAKLGVIAVPINFRLSPAEIAYILNDSQSRILVCHGVLEPLVTPILSETSVTPTIMVNKSADGNSAQLHYEDVLAASTDTTPDTYVDQQDPLMMMYTSGTTGHPKGALLTHANASWSAVNAMMSDFAITRQDVTLTIAPLFHIGALAATLPVLYMGAKVVVQAQFDPAGALKVVEDEGVTNLFLVPAMWQALSMVPDFDKYDLSTLRFLTSGGSPCPIPVIEFFQQRGLRFFEGFGMTETTAGACILGNEDAVRKHGSVGKPLIHMQMRIVDENDQDVRPGETGELVVRGPNVFSEYWNKPEATAEAFRGGWFHTGDLARQDEEGFFYIVDRKKDMLISGGENVYPTEVEHVLYRYPGVQEVTVIGVPDETWGEVPMALVVPAGDAEITLEDIQEFCRDKLARFKTPKQLAVLDELPRTATGKVLKRELRKQYAAQ